MKKIFVILLSLSFVACTDNKIQQEAETLNFNIERNDSVSSDFVEFTDFLKLNEADHVSVNAISKLLIHNDTIYVFDKFGQNTVVAFDMQGNYIRKYSRRGKSKSEYIRLFDFDVDDSYVYLYDRMQKKMLLYGHDGKFAKAIKTDFNGDGFVTLKGNRFLFSLGRDNGGEELCLTDSVFKIQDVLLKYDKDNKADLLTGNLFQKCNDTIYYNRPLNDIVYKFTLDGENAGTYRLDFDGRNIPRERQHSYVKLTESGDESKYVYTEECPLFVNNKMIGQVYNRGKRCVIYYDLMKKDGGINDCEKNSRDVQDIMVPLHVSDIYIIGYINLTMLKFMKTTGGIPENMVEYMQDGNTVLVFYKMKK